MRTTEHPVKIRSPRTGIFATLRAHLPAKGTGAPSPAGRLLSASLLAILALFAFTAAPALAAAPADGILSWRAGGDS